MSPGVDDKNKSSQKYRVISVIKWSQQWSERFWIELFDEKPFPKVYLTQLYSINLKVTGNTG